jgi:hypothetical protein
LWQCLGVPPENNVVVGERSESMRIPTWLLPCYSLECVEVEFSEVRLQEPA